MTISTVLNRKQYDGNDAATAFSFPYKFIENTDIVVILTDTSGVNTTKALDTDYTMTGAGTDSAGIITMILAPASGELLTIYRDLDEDQETDLTNQTSAFLSRIEAALDYVTMITQQLTEQIGRAVKNTIVEGPNSTSPADLANFSGFDSVIVTNIAAMMLIDTDTALDAKVLGFTDINDGSGGSYRYNAAGLESSHNGGTLISPQRSGVPGDATWWTAPTTGTDGLWEKITNHEIFDSIGRYFIDILRATGGSNYALTLPNALGTGPLLFDASGIASFGGVSIITSIANVTATNMKLGNIHTLSLAENTTFSAPTNTQPGARHTWVITKDATATARAIAWSAVFDFDNGVKPESLLVTGARVIVEGIVQTSGIILCTIMGQSGWKSYTGAIGATEDFVVTCASATLNNVLFAKATPYKTSDGVWKIKGSVDIDISASGGARTTTSIGISGIVIKTGSGQQALTSYAGNFPFDTSAFGTPATIFLTVAHPSSTAGGRFQVSFDMEIDGKPLWAK